MNASSIPDLVSVVDVNTLDLQLGDPVDVIRGTPIASVPEMSRDQVVECGVWEVTPGECAGRTPDSASKCTFVAAMRQSPVRTAQPWNLVPASVRRAARLARSLGRSRDAPQDLRDLAPARAIAAAVVSVNPAFPTTAVSPAAW